MTLTQGAVPQWRPIVGWEGFYEVSSAGEVRGCDRVCQRSDGTIQTWRGRPIKAYPNSKGYLVARLSRPGKRGLERVHRLVAEAFLPAAHTTETVNHKDGDKRNNGVEKLEWATRRENTLHAIANGLGEYIPPWRKPPPPEQP